MLFWRSQMQGQGSSFVKSTPNKDLYIFEAGIGNILNAVANILVYNSSEPRFKTNYFVKSHSKWSNVLAFSKKY